MPEDNPEITFPSIKFPIVTDLNVNAAALARHYGSPPPESLCEATSIVLTNLIVNLFSDDRISHRPTPGDDDNIDIKGACFLYIIGTAVYRVLAEQGNEIDLTEMYGRSGRAIFQAFPEDQVSLVLQEGQSLAERLFEEAITNGEINEYVLFVMSMGLLYSIEPKAGAMESIVSLFEQIRDI